MVRNAAPRGFGRHCHCCRQKRSLSELIPCGVTQGEGGAKHGPWCHRCILTKLHKDKAFIDAATVAAKHGGWRCPRCEDVCPCIKCINRRSKDIQPRRLSTSGRPHLRDNEHSSGEGSPEAMSPSSLHLAGDSYPGARKPFRGDLNLSCDAESDADNHYPEDGSYNACFKNKSTFPRNPSDKSLIPATPDNNHNNAAKHHNEYLHSQGAVPTTPCRGKRSSLSSHFLNLHSPRPTLLSQASESVDMQSPVKLSRMPWTWEMCQPTKNHLAGLSLPSSHSLPSESPLSSSMGGKNFAKPTPSSGIGGPGFGAGGLPLPASTQSDTWSPLSQSPPSPSAMVIIPSTPGRHRRFSRKGMPARGDSGLDYFSSPLKDNGGSIVNNSGGSAAVAWSKDGAANSPRCVMTGGADRSTPKKASAAGAATAGKAEETGGGKGKGRGGLLVDEEDSKVNGADSEAMMQELNGDGDGDRDVSLEKLERLRSGMRESLMDASCFFSLDADVMADVSSPQKRIRTTASPRGSGTIPLQGIVMPGQGGSSAPLSDSDAKGCEGGQISTLRPAGKSASAMSKSLSAKKERGYGNTSGNKAMATPTAATTVPAAKAGPSAAAGAGVSLGFITSLDPKPEVSASPASPRPATSSMSEDVNQICEDMDVGDDVKKHRARRAGGLGENEEDIARSVDSWKFLVASMFVEKDSSPKMQELVVSLLDYIPSAEAATAVTAKDLQAAMKSLGMPSDGAQAVIQLSRDFKRKAWSSVSELSHVSKYTAEAHAAYCSERTRQDDAHMVCV